jgi:long-subunit acyl-CoA synthetase (AMP-forming)
VEFLEAEFGKCELVEQIGLYGSSFEATLVAVVVPIGADMHFEPVTDCLCTCCVPLLLI